MQTLLALLFHKKVSIILQTSRGSLGIIFKFIIIYSNDTNITNYKLEFEEILSCHDKFKFSAITPYMSAHSLIFQ